MPGELGKNRRAQQTKDIAQCARDEGTKRCAWYWGIKSEMGFGRACEGGQKNKERAEHEHVMLNNFGFHLTGMRPGHHSL